MATAIGRNMFRRTEIISRIFQRVHPLSKHKSVTIQTRTLSEEVGIEYIEDDEIHKLRDVSNLNERAKRKIKKLPPDLEPTEYEIENKINVRFRKSIAYQRKLYGKYGSASGVDPGILWPSRTELRRMREEEERFEGALHDKLEEVTRQKEERILQYEQKIQQITEGMEKMPSLIEKYNKDLLVKEKERKKLLQKRETMLEEIREELGLQSLNLYDRRIRLMMDEKVKKEKQAIKEQKKKRRNKAKTFQIEEEPKDTISEVTS